MKKLILGPPGTGKTTKLLSVVDACLTSGIPPERIAYVTFTKSGATEAKDRAIAKFGFTEKQFPHFRTLHSMCYRETGCRKVMGWREYKDLSDELGYNVTGNSDLDMGYTHGQRIRHVEEQSRTRCIHISEAAVLLEPELNPYQIKQYAQILADFKRVHSVPDFTDLLEQYTHMNKPLDVDVVIVDEAQDLTELQWRVVEVMSRDAEDVYYAGDDDQTVHVWAGACIERFMRLGNLCDDTEVLGHSYRLPRAVHEYANKISSRIHGRYEKDWEDNGEEGLVSRVAFHSMSHSLPIKQGDWMMLARNRTGLEKYIDLCKHQGLFFKVNGELYLGDVLGWITKWENLRAGKKLPWRDVQTLLSKCLRDLPFEGSKGMTYSLAELGLKTDAVWFDAFDKIPLSQRKYLQACLRGGENPNKVRIRIMTIHASKGMESENVVLLSDTGRASQEELYREPDSEHRVFYVGATRAKQNLYLVHESQECFYPL